MVKERHLLKIKEFVYQQNVINILNEITDHTNYNYETLN